MITIRQIAKIANVSRSTVSRVLNNSGYVNESTRKKVLQVIEETGYIPSEQAKSFRTKKTKVIGVILPTIQTETSGKIVSGIDDILFKNGYQILLANTNLDSKRELEFLELLTARRVEGIILIATNTSPTLVEKIQKLGIPVVVIGQEIDGVPNILFDDYNSAREVVSHLISKGHSKISIITVDEKDVAVGYNRFKGYLDACSESGLEIKDHWIQKGIFNIQSGYEAMQRIMEKPDRPTAVFAVTDRLAFGAMKYLKNNGYEIPRDFAVVSIGSSEMSEYIDPQLTTVDYNRVEAGKKAAEELLSIIAEEKRQGDKIILHYQLIERKSV